MARNGVGTYVLPAGNPVVSGSTISSSVQNATMSDIAAAISQSVSNDGQTPIVANLPMSGFRHTGTAAASARTDYAQAAQVQDSSMCWLTSVAGTDTITASLTTPTLTAYAVGQEFAFVPAGANTTTSVTLNINGIGAKAITKYGAGALAIGDIISSSVCKVVYDGTQFQLLNSIGVPLGGVHAANLSAIPSATGTDTYTVTTSSTAPLTTLADGQLLLAYFGNSNTLTNPTVNPDGLGAKSIVRQDGGALIAGQLAGPCLLSYNMAAGNFRLMTIRQRPTTPAHVTGSTSLTSSLNGRVVVVDAASVQTLPTITADINGMDITLVQGAITGTIWTLSRSDDDLIAMPGGLVSSIKPYTFGDFIALRADNTGTGRWLVTAYGITGPSVMLAHTGSQTLTAGAYTKLQFNSVVSDVLGLFDATTNYRFTADRPGWYDVGITAYINSTNAIGGVLLYKNGVEYERGQSSYSPSDGCYTYSGQVWLAANDYVEAYGICSGATGTFGSSVGSRFSILRRP